MRQQGMKPAKSTGGVTAAQMGRSGRLYRLIMILGLSLWLHIGDPVIVILNKDKVVACCMIHNERIELAKMSTWVQQR